MNEDFQEYRSSEAAMVGRIHRVRRLLQEKRLTGLLVYSRENTYYLSGFSGTDSMLLITDDKALLLTDFRYIEQAGLQSPHFEVIDSSPDMMEAVKKHMTAAEIFNLGVEEDSLSYRQSIRLRENENLVLQPFQDVLTDIRSVKDKFEQELMQKAAQIAEASLQAVLPAFVPGRTEEEVAAALEYEMRKRGASGASFATIVASGPRSALPHGVASQRKMQAGDAIVVDFGCVWRGYCSDMTRTFFLGRPQEEAIKVYELVLKAHLKALRALKAGMTGAEADKIARLIIEKNGYGEAFGHALGHGVGLAIHEAPRLSQTGCHPLKAGQVVTVEPGIYLPGRFGVRIEDTAVIVAEGAASLNNFSKQLTILPV